MDKFSLFKIKALPFTYSLNSILVFLIENIFVALELIKFLSSSLMVFNFGSLN